MAVDWQWANDFLSRGRKKYERPLYDRGLRIWKENKWDPDSNIHVGWKYGGSGNAFVIYHKDGTTTIQGHQQPTHWGGSWLPLRSYSVRFTIQRYAGIQVSQRNWQYHLTEDDAPLTPPKIQGCRTCRQTGKVDAWCNSHNCYDGEKGPDGKMHCETHPDAQFLGVQYQYRWHALPCEHGNLDGHMVPKAQTCYSCGGNKKRDYGSKYQTTIWDGSPLRLRDGKIIKSAASLLERMVADYVDPVG
jgi:hypothetical protein